MVLGYEKYGTIWSLVDYWRLSVAVIREVYHYHVSMVVLTVLEKRLCNKARWINYRNLQNGGRWKRCFLKAFETSCPENRVGGAGFKGQQSGS